MSLDFSAALKAPASVQGWFVKILIGGILMCIPIVNFIVFGYLIRYIKNVIDKNEILPEYSDIGELFVTGFKGLIGIILLYIPLILITIIIGLLFSKSASLAMILNYLIEIVYGFITMIMVANFAIDKKILSMVGFNRAALLFKNNPNIGSLILYLIAVNIIYGIVATVCAITVIGIILVPFIVFAMMITLYNLIAQFVQNAPCLEEVKAQAA